MHKEDIITLVRYMFWADQKVLDACTQVPTVDFVRVVSPDPGWHSLRGTLVHALDTAYGWRAALQGLETAEVLNEGAFADVASLRQRWDEEKGAWLAYVAALTDQDLNAIWWSDGKRQRVRWQTIMHVVNDATHHRSEAAAILTGFGQSPGDLDFDQYLVDVFQNLAPDDTPRASDYSAG